MNRIIVDMSKVNTTELAQETGLPTKEVEKVVRQIITDKNNNRRQPRPPAPEGGISLRAAARKYGVPNPTLSVWVKRGYIPILLRTRNWLYVEEKELAQIVELYKRNPGQGKKTILKEIASSPY